MTEEALIQAIVFNPDGGIDITYAEQREFTAQGTILRQLMVPVGVVDPSDVLDSIKELLDLALEKMHEAPDRISRR